MRYHLTSSPIRMAAIKKKREREKEKTNVGKDIEKFQLLYKAKWYGYDIKQYGSSSEN